MSLDVLILRAAVDEGCVAENGFFEWLKLDYF